MGRTGAGWKMLGLEQSLGSHIVNCADDLAILCRRGKAKWPRNGHPGKREGTLKYRDHEKGRTRIAFGPFLCSIRKPFLRPDLALSSPPRADAVKVGRRVSRAANSDFARPYLDGGKHGGTLAPCRRRSRSRPAVCSATKRIIRNTQASSPVPLPVLTTAHRKCQREVHQIVRLPDLRSA
jgi:hypothetical protein